MRKELNDRNAIVQMILLDRWNPHRLDKKIASHFDLTLDQVRDIRQQPAFQEEVERQRLMSEQPFVNLADRKARAVALQQLFEKVPDVRVALRLKILGQIRSEVLDDKPIPHANAVEVPGPAHTGTYGEWLDRNHSVESR